MSSQDPKSFCNGCLFCSNYIDILIILSTIVNIDTINIEYFESYVFFIIIIVCDVY